MFLGIDLGTSEVKLLLMDARGVVAGQASAPLTLARPQALWCEQDPAAWWAATQQAIDAMRAGWPDAWSQVRAIGLSGQMHGAVLLGVDDSVLRPAILWNDGRSHAECQELERLAPQLHTVAANLAMPGFTAPKLLWLRRHEPTCFARVASVLLPKDWLRLQLCGEKVSEPSDAAGTLWLDVARRDWSDELLAVCGLRRAHMPRLVESNAISGWLKPELAEAWGLRGEVLIAGGAGDNAASAIGIGATEPGDGFISLGTSGVLFVVNDCLRPNPALAVHAFCHALPGRWHQMSVLLSAASCLRWFTQFSGAASESALLGEVAQLSAAECLAAPLFLPYLAGERTPHNDPFAQGLLFGLSAGTRRAQAGYAVLEGVAFALADGLAALQQAGTSVQRLSLVGGGSRSTLWTQLIADTLDLELVVPGGAEAGAALGAARLAALAAGADPATVCQAATVAASCRPDSQRHQRLQPRLRRYRALYQSLRPLMAESHPFAESLSA